MNEVLVFESLLAVGSKVTRWVKLVQMVTSSPLQLHLSFRLYITDAIPLMCTSHWEQNC